MTDISKHPILREIYNLTQQAEDLGCSPQFTDHVVAIGELMEQAARLVADNERLRAALGKLARLGNGPHLGNSTGNRIAQDALKGSFQWLEKTEAEVPSLGKEESITGVSRPSDTELLRRAIVNARPEHGYISRVRWACVMDLLMVGSTTATILCREAGLDPDHSLTGVKCAWIQRGDGWHTECGSDFDIDSDGPGENGYAFCPGCGKEVITKEGGAE